MFWNWLALVCLLSDSCSPNSAYRQKDGSSAAVEFTGTITVNNSDATSNQIEAEEDAMLDDLLNSQMAVINQSMPPPVKKFNGKKPAMANTLSADDPLATKESWSLRLIEKRGRKLTFQMERSDEGYEGVNVESNENPIVRMAKSMVKRGKKNVTVSLPTSKPRDICAMLLHPMYFSGGIKGMDPVLKTLGRAAINQGMPYLFFLRETYTDAVTEYKQVLSAARHSETLGCKSFVLMGYSTGAAVAAAMLGEFWNTAMDRISKTIKGFVGVSPPVRKAGALVGEYGPYKMTAMITAVSVPKYLVWGSDDDWGPTKTSEAQEYGVPENDAFVVQGEDHFWRKKPNSLADLYGKVRNWLEDNID